MELQALFSDALKSENYRLIEGVNPFRVELNGKELWIYIKHLTSAHFKNKNVYRAQFPKRDLFDAIKDSNDEFVLLGYDPDNDVYSSWNPLWIKQRLNERINISLYSRLSLQQESRQEGEFKWKALANDSEVVIFPRELVELFLMDVQSYFHAEGDYVAIGSKRRPEANEAFRTFNSTSSVTGFAPYLAKLGLHPTKVGTYCRIVKRLISDGLFGHCRKLFYQYDSLAQYPLAFDRFVAVEEVAAKDEEWNHQIIPVLSSYIDYLTQVSPEIKPDEENLPLIFEISEADPSVTEKEPGQYVIPEEEPHLLEDGGSVPYGRQAQVAKEQGEQLQPKNWEAEYTDANGKWTKIANPEVIDLIRPYLAGEYQQPLVAFNLIQDYYGDRLPKMSLAEWYKLMNDIDWSDPYVHEEAHEDRQNATSGSDDQTTHTRTKKFTLRVEFPDGHVIQEKVVGDTYIAAIKEIEPDLVELVEISHAGVSVVSKTLNERYAKYQKPVGDGWYVMTNSSTQTKFNDLVRISDVLELGLRVTLVPLDSGTETDVETE